MTLLGLAILAGTLALLERGYYWPNIRDDVINYVKTCLVCQQDKVDREWVIGTVTSAPNTLVKRLNGLNLGAT